MLFKQHTYKRRFLSLASLLSLSFLHTTAPADELTVGHPAPDFALPDQHSIEHRLASYRGQWLVLYFYPKADTAGCTTEACQFRDDIYQYQRLNVKLLGISTDNVKSQQEFAEKHHLPFPLLSDPDGSTATSYDSFTSIGPLRFAKRHTFIIDPDGRIAHIFSDVDPQTHNHDVLAALKLLCPGSAKVCA